jgi:hypothetical protein
VVPPSLRLVPCTLGPFLPAPAPGYKERILFPMDLSLVRKMIVARMIKSFSSLHHRVALICHNCVKFNGRYVSLSLRIHFSCSPRVVECSDPLFGNSRFLTPSFLFWHSWITDYWGPQRTEVKAIMPCSQGTSRITWTKRSLRPLRTRLRLLRLTRRLLLLLLLLTVLLPLLTAMLLLLPLLLLTLHVIRKLPLPLMPPLRKVNNFLRREKVE